MFKYESDMIPVIKTVLPRILDVQGTFAWANELPVNNRVVDVAAAPVDRMCLEGACETARVLTRLGMIQMSFLAKFTDGKPVSMQQLCRQTFMEPGSVHQIFINPCLRLGLIRRESRYTYTSTEWTMALPPYIVAIEAKLTRWQDVLKQARENLVFADVSFAALDRDCLLTCSRCLGDFENDGIGILSIHTSGEVDVVIQPRQSPVRGFERGLQMIRMLRDLYRPHKSKWKLSH